MVNLIHKGRLLPEERFQGDQRTFPPAALEFIYARIGVGEEPTDRRRQVLDLASLHGPSHEAILSEVGVRVDLCHVADPVQRRELGKCCACLCVKEGRRSYSSRLRRP